MVTLNERYIVDGKGKKTQVILDYEVFVQLLEELEMLDDVRAYDQAKADASGQAPGPFAQAIDEIKRSRRNTA